MAALWKDLCRELVPHSTQYYDYGLWLPPPKYRPESEYNGDSPHAGRLEQVEITPLPQPTVNEAQNEELVKLVKGPLEQNFDEISGGKPHITSGQAGDLARKLGFAPSLAEIGELNNNTGGRVTRQDVEGWLKTVAHSDDNVESIIGMFQYYDRTNAGTLSRKQMANILRSFGEPLTDAEVQALYSEMGAQEEIDYRLFVEKLLAL